MKSSENAFASAKKKRRAFLKGAGSVLGIKSHLPVKKYTLQEAIQHDSEMFWHDFARATVALREELSPDQKAVLEDKIIESGATVHRSNVM